MNRNNRLAQVTRAVKRDWLPDLIESEELDKQINLIKLDNSCTDLELMGRGLL